MPTSPHAIPPIDYANADAFEDEGWTLESSGDGLEIDLFNYLKPDPPPYFTMVAGFVLGVAGCFLGGFAQSLGLVCVSVIGGAVMSIGSFVWFNLRPGPARRLDQRVIVNRLGIRSEYHYGRPTNRHGREVPPYDFIHAALQDGGAFLRRSDVAVVTHQPFGNNTLICVYGKKPGGERIFVVLSGDPDEAIEVGRQVALQLATTFEPASDADGKVPA